MLVPVGLALDWVFWRDPFMFGVLEALGLTVVMGAAVAAVVPRRVLPMVAVAMLAVGIWSERAIEGRQEWLAHEALGGKFPLVTNLGFVLVGVVAVRTGWYSDRRRVFAVASVAVLATLAMLADGIVPDRYPGDIHFVLPGLAITTIAYALCQYSWPAILAGFDQVLRRAAAHTLGIFLGHYLIFGALRRFDLLGSIEPVVAVPASLAVATALCLVAPRVPQLPWSLRTGRRRAPAARPAVVGWSRRPLHDCALPGSWGRRKRWDFWGVIGPGFALNLVYADADYVGIADVWFCDLTSGGSVGKSVPVPLARDMQLPDTVGGAPMRFDQGGLALSLEEETAGTRLRVAFSGGATAGESGDGQRTGDLTADVL